MIASSDTAIEDPPAVEKSIAAAGGTATDGTTGEVLDRATDDFCEAPPKISLAFATASAVTEMEDPPAVEKSVAAPEGGPTCDAP